MFEIKKYYVKLILLLATPIFPKLYLALPFLLRKRLNFSYINNHIKIQAILFFLIVYILTYEVVKFSDLPYRTIQSVTPFVIFLFLSFIKYDFDFLVKIKNCVYTIFYIDLFVNVISVLINTNLNRDQINYFDSFYHSLSGFYNHPYLCASISLVTFLYAFLFKDKRMQIFAICNLFFVSSLRSTLLIYPVIIAYIALSNRYRFLTLLVSLFIGFILIFQYVKYDSNEAYSDRCKFEIHTSQYGNCEVLNSSALRLHAWKFFFQTFSQINILGNLSNPTRKNYTNLTPKIIEEKKIFESPYFQYTYDYGFIFSFFLIYLFLHLMHVNYKNAISKIHNSFKKNLYTTKLFICCIYFFDTFYGVFFFTPISLLTLPFILYFYDNKKL